MTDCAVYVYGMTVLSTIHQLKGPYPAANTYQEIQQTFVMPGGEGANCAVVLRNLGVRVRLDGCFLGDLTREPLLTYFGARDIDCSRLTHQADFPGWRDIVLCDGDSRTVFGWFGQLLFGDENLWTPPCEESIRAARYVALDPFFRDASAQVAEWCVKHNTPYVTIDCRWDDRIAQQARAIVCSQEFLDREYPGQSYDALLEQYRAVCGGLVIFTFGSEPIRYGSPTTPQAQFTPYQVPIVDTLGAGDTFRAGVVYGLLRGMAESEIVHFASACATVACTRFPSVHQPPELSAITALMNSRSTA
ncbi:MAG: carbohydrate kinase family protein [Anaerolineae bacterium]|nr:carbohydrate kinase family protein [Anaerolineae bacterium]